MPTGYRDDTGLPTFTGRHHTEESKRRMSKARQGKVPWNKGIKYVAISGENNHRWQGDSIGYSGVHQWLRKNFQKPKVCQTCGTTERRLEWANISGKYKRDISDYIALCKPCHRIFDNVTEKSLETRKRNNTVVVWTPEMRLKMSLLRRGRPSPRKGIKLSEETKNKLRIANLGKKLSDETKKKMSEMRKGIKPKNFDEFIKAAEKWNKEQKSKKCK